MSTKCIYNTLLVNVKPKICSKLPLLDFSIIWQNVHCNFVDSHINELCWRMSHNALPVNDHLYSFQMVPHNTPCYFCNIGCETVAHLFFECSFLQSLWKKVTEILCKYSNRNVILDRNCILYNIFKESVHRPDNLMLLLLVNSMKYQIWKFRNTSMNGEKIIYL